MDILSPLVVLLCAPSVALLRTACYFAAQHFMFCCAAKVASVRRQERGVGHG